MNDATSAKEEIVTTESEMPDPVDMLRKTTLRVHEIMAGIRQEQGDAATPCTEWNVRQVMNHVIGGAEVLAGSLEGTMPEGIGGVSANSSYSDETDIAKLAQAYAGEAARALAAAQRSGAMDNPTPGSMMTMPQFLIAMANDHIVHGWDLARATGQDDTLDPDVVRASYAMIIAPETARLVEMGRQFGFIGPAVAVSDDASLQDKLIAHMGRQP